MKIPPEDLQPGRHHDPGRHERLIEKELAQFISDLKNERLSALPTTVRKILDCIHGNLFSPALTVFALKRRCGVKNNNISTVFKKAVGTGIRKYIEGRRIMAAMRLLGHEGLEIFLIGAAVGYSYEESFTRAFRRCLGCTPSQYRREIVKKKCQTK